MSTVCLVGGGLEDCCVLLFVAACEILEQAFPRSARIFDKGDVFCAPAQGFETERACACEGVEDASAINLNAEIGSDSAMFEDIEERFPRAIRRGSDVRARRCRDRPAAIFTGDDSQS